MLSAPRIALWGAFDLEDCGRLAIPRVLAAELQRRLPGAIVTVFAPLGRLRPIALDGGRSAEPLAALDAAGVADLGARFDCILACTGDPLTAPEQATELWGDPAAAALLREPPDATMAGCPVIPIELWSDGGPPPPTLFLPRLLSPATLDARAQLMRLLEWVWEGERVISVHGDHGLLGEVKALAAALGPLVESGVAAVQLSVPGRLRGEEGFATALETALGGRCRRLRAEAQLEDQVAVLRGSAAVLGPEGFGVQTARALRVPSATLPLDDAGAVVTRLLDPDRPRPAPPAEAIARLDGYLDRLAGQAVVASALRAVVHAEPGPTLAEAHAALGRRLFAERRAFRSAHDGEVRRLQAEADRLRAELDAARAANDAIVGSRTWRYSQPVRDRLARLRERRG